MTGACSEYAWASSGCHRVALGQVHPPQVDAERGHRAPLEPEGVGEAAVEAGCRAGRAPTSASVPDRRRGRGRNVCTAWTRTSHRTWRIQPRVGIRWPSVRTARSRASAEAAMSPRLNASSPSTPSIRTTASSAVARPRACLELALGLLVPAPQHQGPAELLGDVALPVEVLPHAALRDPELLLDQLQRLLGPGLVRGGERVRQGALGRPGGVEVEGQVEEPGGAPGLEQRGALLVQPAALLGVESLQQRLADLVVHEAAPVGVGPPDQVATAGLAHRTSDLHRVHPAERGGHGRARTPCPAPRRRRAGVGSRCRAA